MKSARFRLRVAAKDGEDVLQAVTDNQHDSFALDSKGKALAAQQRSTNVRLWLGSEQQTISSVVATLSYVGGGSVPSGVTVGYNITTDSGAAAGNVAIVNVNVKKNTVLTDDIQCTIIVTCADGSRTVVFSLSRVMSGADGKTPVRWQLLLSQTQLAFQRTRGGFTPAQQVVGVQVQRDDGNDIVNMGLEQAYYDYHMAVCAATGEPPSSYSSSQRIDRDITVSNTDVGDGVSAIGLSLFDIASSTAFLHDKQSLTIVKDGADGNEGAPGKSFRRIYKSTNSSTAPSTPTGSSPSGWSATPTTVSSSARYRYMSEGSSSDGGSTWGNWSSPVLDIYLPEDGTSISIKGRAIAVFKSQDDSDYDMDGCPASDLVVDGYATQEQIDQIQDGDVFLYNYQHDLADHAVYSASDELFHDDGYAAEGDCYIDMTGVLWEKVRSSSIYWRDLGQIKGDKGDKGDDGDNAVLHQLMVSPSEVVYNTNAVGDYIGPATTNVQATVMRTEGDGTPEQTNGVYYICSRMLQEVDSEGTRQYTAWNVGTKATTTMRTVLKSYATRQPTASTPRTVAVEFCLSTEQYGDGTIVARREVPVILGGSRGAQGSKGQSYYTMGQWEAKDYTVTDRGIPMVYHGNVWNPRLGIYGDYWYLKADAATASDEPSNSSNVWGRADDFGVVISGAIFALFAKLGGFVVCGDFFLSQYGQLMASPTTPYSGTTEEPAYTYFSDADPMAQLATGSWPRFRPRLCINAANGEMWMASGKMHVSAAGDITMQGASMTEATVSGTVRASNLFRTLAVLVTGQYGSYKVYSPDSPEGEPWRYMNQTAYDDIADAEPTLAPQWPVGSYLSYSQYMDTFGGSNAAGMWGELTECIGYADMLEVISSGTQDIIIRLPRCQDVPGKLVEVSNLHSSATLQVYQADQASAFQFIDGNGSLYSRMPVAAATQVSFYSTGLRWLAIYGSST